MRFFTRKTDVVVSRDVPEISTIDRYGGKQEGESQAKVSEVQKRDKHDGGTGKKRDKDSKKKMKKKKEKSKKDKEKRISQTSSSKLVDRVPTVESAESTTTQDVGGEKSRGDVHVSVASDDDGDDRYSVAGHLSRGGRSSAGVSVLSDDSDEYGARWRSWDDDDDVENRDSSPTDDEMAAKSGKKKKSSKKKKKKKKEHKSKDKSDKKKKKRSKSKSKSKRIDEGVRDQPDGQEKHSPIETQQQSTSMLNEHLIQVLGANVTDGQDHTLIEEVEIEHLFDIPAEIEEATFAKTPLVENCQEEDITSIAANVKKSDLSYTRSIIPDDTFEVDNEDGVVTTLTAGRTTNNKELLELDEYSVHELENKSALVQCLHFYSCNGIARLLEFQPKMLPPAAKEDSSKLPIASTNQNYELMLGVKSPIASDPAENVLVGGASEDSLDNLHEAPSLDTLKRNPSVIVDLTGKNLCLEDDESVEDARSRKTGRSSRRRKKTPRNGHKVTVTSIEIPESKTHNISHGVLTKGKKSNKLAAMKGDKSVKSMPEKNKKAPKRGMWLPRRRSNSDEISVCSGRSASSSKASTSVTKKRRAQSFFLRMQGKRAQC